ncbi:TIGR01459 family HAD-type hydrolase [Parvularcula sp. IMCC14364]|uniref:TIGR01459 family HAD-type hydrolase n=1 Tax=Parvularcula sp. IMCC14364 TaxID=3067902 RepID=UPI0027411124|nr:TIGR01459 family HAD-type hydrolase [Parvularcula sp. IMCC14364]
MNAPLHISGLAEIADQYDALLCDAWGVIHNGIELFPGVADALTNFRETRGPVFILTNAPRLNDVIPPQLDRLGLPRSAYDGVVTSGDATRASVEAFRGQPAFRLGPDKDDTLFEALDIEFVPLEQAKFILCTGLFDDSTETPEDYREMLSQAKELNLPMICANPDTVVQLGDRMIYCGGALAQVYDQLGGETLLSGKPHEPIYDLAMSRLTKANNGTPPQRVLAVGDGLQTDILGANRHDLDVVFVAHGIFSKEARNDAGVLDMEKLNRLLSDHDVHAHAAMDQLAW